MENRPIASRKECLTLPIHVPARAQTPMSEYALSRELKTTPRLAHRWLSNHSPPSKRAFPPKPSLDRARELTQTLSVRGRDRHISMVAAEDDDVIAGRSAGVRIRHHTPVGSTMVTRWPARGGVQPRLFPRPSSRIRWRQRKPLAGLGHRPGSYGKRTVCHHVLSRDAGKGTSISASLARRAFSLPSGGRP